MFDLHTVRISGCEPTINPEHLLRVVGLAHADGYRYMLDTNGLLVTEELLDRLEPYKDKVYVYMGLKGANPDHFQQMTKADARFWYRQLATMRMFHERGYIIGANLMANLTPPEMLDDLFWELNDISSRLAISLDLKTTTLFPYIVARIRAHGLHLGSGLPAQRRWQYLLDTELGQEVSASNIEWMDGLKFLHPLPST